MISQSPLAPKENQDKLKQIMFETFNVNALYLCDQGVLELYSAGRMSGIVLNVGEGCTHVVPVHEGYCLHHAVKRLPYSGKDISERLRQIMA